MSESTFDYSRSIALDEYAFKMGPDIANGLLSVENKHFKIQTPQLEKLHRFFELCVYQKETKLSHGYLF